MNPDRVQHLNKGSNSDFESECDGMDYFDDF